MLVTTQCTWQYARPAQRFICTASLLQTRAAFAKQQIKPQCSAASDQSRGPLFTRPWATPAHVSSSSKRWGILSFASNAADASPPPERPRSRIATVFHTLARVITAAIRVFLSLLLFISIAPYIISSKWGTKLASSLASRVLPGDVNIHRIQLGWAEPIAVEGLEVHELKAKSSRQLLSIPKMKTAETLYSVLWGSGITLTITKPQIDCSLDDSGDQARLAAYFQAANMTHLFSRPGSSSSGGGSSSSKNTVSATQQQLLPSDPSSSSSDQQQHKAVDVTSHPILADEGDLQATEAAAAADALAAAAAAMSPMRQRLTVADSVAQFSAELMLPRLAIYIPDGELLLPAEVRAAVGTHIHAIAAVGQQQVTELAAELSEDASWLQQQQQELFGSGSSTAATAAAGSSDQGSDDQDRPAAAAAASWQIPPRDVSSRAWQDAQPVLMQVTGDHLDALMRGWRLTNGHLVLQQPAAANWEFTPELARLTLSLYNPLFQEVAYVREGGHVMSYYTPENGLLPATSGQVTVTPLKFVVGQGQLLKQVYRLLDMAQGTGILRKPWSADRVKGGVHVWSGPMAVQIDGPGLYTTKRVDMLVGSGSQSIHLAVWGTVDTLNNTVSMTIGLPASTLAKIGIKNLPETYMLPLAVTGDLSKPQLEWATAVRKLAVLSAMQLGSRVMQGEGLGFGNPNALNPNDQAPAGAGFSEQRPQQQGLSGVLFPGWFGAANRALTNAASSFIGQVDQRLQQELIDVPAPADLPWRQSHKQPEGRGPSSVSATSGSDSDMERRGQDDS